MSKYITYEQSGVSIDAGEEMVNQISSAVASTFGPRVIQSTKFIDARVNFCYL